MLMATRPESSIARRHGAAFAAWALAACGAVAVTLDARADDTIRCRNGRLVSVGMTTLDVTDRCGQPQSRTAEDIPVRARLPNGNVVQTGTTRAELWVYQRGPGQFDAQLTFEDDKLVRIDFLTEP
jgi:hypothetical protein